MLRHSLDGVARKSSHEGLVSHRSAVWGRDLCGHPDRTTRDATWCRAERQSGAGHHLRALPPSSSAGVQTLLSLCPTRLPRRLPRCWRLLRGLCRLLWARVLRFSRLLSARLLWVVPVLIEEGLLAPRRPEIDSRQSVPQAIPNSAKFLSSRMARVLERSRPERDAAPVSRAPNETRQRQPATRWHYAANTKSPKMARFLRM